MASPASLWHAHRRRLILTEHPEIRRLFGRDPRTAMWIFAVALMHVAMAAAVSRVPWVVVVALSWGLGAWMAHALGVLIHECAHDLVLRRPWANKLLAIVANLPLGAPAAAEFRYQHLLHHQHLGEADGRDTQAPSREEARVLQRHPWLKALSFTFGRFFYPSRPANTVPKDRFFWLNLGACVGFDVVVLALFGWKALVYLLCASLFGFGPHPAGARRLQEHLAVHEEQPSCSYYGLLNWLSFNVGYHVEHHDLPLVPWSRVKQVRALAAPHYDSLFAVRSWPALLARYFLDRRYRVDHYVGMGPQLGAALGYVPLARSADAPAPATARPPRAPNARAA